MTSIGSLFIETSINSAEIISGTQKINKALDSTDKTLRKLGDNPSLDRLRAKYNPLFAVGLKYNKQLADIRKAHELGAISANEMAAAIGREKQIVQASIAAIKGRNDAVVSMGNTTRMAAMQQRNLAFQLNDVAVSLAGGMNPLMVFIQQGSQISQIYGPNEGGVGRALKETGKMITGVVTKFPLVTAAVLAGTAAVAGLTHEINQNSSVIVGFGDTALAVFQVIGGGIYDFIKPAVDMIAPWFSAAWDKVVSGTKTTFNFLINATEVLTYKLIEGFKLIPTAIVAAVNGAANIVIKYTENLINTYIKAINALIKKVNELATKFSNTSNMIDTIDPVAFKRVDNKEATDFIKQRDAINARAEKMMSQDRAGQFFNAVRNQAIANATGSPEEKLGGGSSARVARNTAEDRLKSRANQIFQETRTPQELFKQEMQELDTLVNKGMISWDTYERAVKRAQDRLASTVDTSHTLTNSIADSISRNLQSAQSWQDLGGVALNVLKDIVSEQIRSSSMLKSAGQGIGGFLGNIFSSGGSGLFSSIGSGLSSVGSKIGSFFSAGVAHTGGIVGSPMQGRVVHPSTFARAPRFHSGGIAGNEVPIIAKKGEGVFTKEQMKALGGGGVTVNMNITSPDAQSFMRSKGQIAAEMAMAIRRGQRNL